MSQINKILEVQKNDTFENTQEKNDILPILDAVRKMMIYELAPFKIYGQKWFSKNKNY
jgi:hypothetical protein